VPFGSPVDDRATAQSIENVASIAVRSTRRGQR
jgi:hypothetical protein